MEGNRFSGQHNINYGAMQGDPRRDARNRAKADRQRQLAALIPLLGAGAGAVGGMTLGAATGGPAGMLAGAGTGMKMGADMGNAAGAYMGNQADSLEDPEREREMKRQALLAALTGRKF